MAGERTRERGELEAEVMRVLWSTDGLLSAMEIQQAFQGRTPAYTTLMTALDRLEAKGLVTRDTESPRKVRFRATRSEGEHSSLTMLSTLEKTRDREAALLQFAGNLSDDDTAFLRRAIDARKRA